MLNRVLMQMRANRLIATLARGTVRENSDTVDKLRRIGEPAVAPLIRALHDPDFVTQREAIRALGHLGSVDALRPLTALAKEADPDLATEVHRAIARILTKSERRRPESRESVQ